MPPVERDAIFDNNGTLWTQQPMLQWTAARTCPSFCLSVHHTDAAREWACDRQSSIGKLDKGLDEAKEKFWTVIDMKNDWQTIFPVTP